MHLHCRTVWRLAHPQVEVFPLSRLEEENVVTVIEVGKFIQLVELCFRIQFGVFAAMGQKRVEVVHEVSVSVGDAAGAED